MTEDEFGELMRAMNSSMDRARRMPPLRCPGKVLHDELTLLQTRIDKVMLELIARGLDNSMTPQTWPLSPIEDV